MYIFALILVVMALIFTAGPSYLLVSDVGASSAAGEALSIAAGLLLGITGLTLLVYIRGIEKHHNHKKK